MKECQHLEKVNKILDVLLDETQPGHIVMVLERLETCNLNFLQNAISMVLKERAN